MRMKSMALFILMITGPIIQSAHAGNLPDWVKVKPLEPELANQGYAVIQEVLGIMTKTLHPATAEQYGIKDGGGVIVTDVREDGPAARANIKKGDIILQINRDRVTTVEELATQLRDVEKGDTILLLIKKKTGYIYSSIRLE